MVVRDVYTKCRLNVIIVMLNIIWTLYPDSLMHIVSLSHV